MIIQTEMFIMAKLFKKYRKEYQIIEEAIKDISTVNAIM